MNQIEILETKKSILEMKNSITEILKIHQMTLIAEER